ncbi:MAG: cell wall hydrolase [Lachnospiraceae bacterium]|nr:cell wall hydrolase [Lachnospiraceae bacterium]
MKMPRRIIVYIITTAALLGAAWGDCAYAAPGTAVKLMTTQSQLDDARDAYEDTKDMIEEANETIDDLTGEQAELKLTLDDLNSKLEEAGGILEELEKSITEKKAQIDMTWGTIEEIATQVSALESKADEQYELVKAQIKYIYESGDILYTAMMMGGGTYSDYINRSSYLEMFTEYNQNNIDNLVETSGLLKEKKAEYEKQLIVLEEEKADLDEYEQAVLAKQEEIKQTVEEASKKVKKYSDEIESTEAKLKEYEAKLSAQEDDIEALQAKLEEEKKITEQAANSEWRDLSTAQYSDGDRKLLANLIWCEAGNEPYIGQVAVGAVVMNRVMSSVFPDTIVGVIYQRKQFSPASSGRLALALSLDSASESCYRAADAAMSGVNNIGNCLYFRTPTSAVSPKYVIGGHYFY